MKTLTISVPEPVARWLASTAQERKQTPAEVAGEALANAAQAAEPAPAGPTCFDLMKPLWRSVKGPRDFSQREGLAG